MNSKSSIRKIYKRLLKDKKSKEFILGTFLGMEQMYKQDNLPISDIEEISMIISEIKKGILLTKQ